MKSSNNIIRKTNQLKMYSLIQLNKIFSNHNYILFETSFLELFEKITGNDFMLNTSLIFDCKKTTKRGTTQLTQTIQLVKDFIRAPQIQQGLLSGKKAVINKIISKIIIPNLQSRIFLEKRRSTVIQQLKKQQKISPQDIKLFQVLIQVFLQQKFEHSNNNSNRDLNLKNIKLLTSLRRNMALDTSQSMQSKPANIRKEQSKKCYNINTDIKAIFQQIITKYEEVPTIEKLKILMIKAGTNKWFGPRMYRLLSKQNWSMTELELLKRILTSENVNFKKYRSNSDLLRKTFTKIKRNLRKHIHSLKGDKLELISNFDNPESDDLSLFDLQLLPSQPQTIPETKLENQYWDNKRNEYLIQF